MLGAVLQEQFLPLEAAAEGSKYQFAGRYPDKTSHLYTVFRVVRFYLFIYFFPGYSTDMLSLGLWWSVSTSWHRQVLTVAPSFLAPVTPQNS